MVTSLVAGLGCNLSVCCMSVDVSAIASRQLAQENIVNSSKYAALPLPVHVLNVTEVLLAPIVNTMSPDCVQDVEVIFTPVCSPPCPLTTTQISVPLTALTHALTE